MKETSYKEFSRAAHHKNLDSGKPTDCQFELTFGCDYRCPHCYASCYNQKTFLKKELKTNAVKIILAKMRRAGVLWLCLTGGDPLTRDDFSEVYAHAKRLGFIITVFTNGFRVAPGLIRSWQKAPPFLVEVTLNAASERLYDKISGYSGSFHRVSRALDLLQSASMSVKLKMQVTQENQHELPAVRALARKRRLPLEPSFLLHPRLDGDQAPCRLRPSLPLRSFSKQPHRGTKKPLLFPCAIDSAARLLVDPYGYGFLCCFLRHPKYDLKRVSVARAREAALDYVRSKHYQAAAVCPSCPWRAHCVCCPGLAYLETKNVEAVVPYYCQLALLSVSESQKKR